jgi:N-acetylglucosamine kinase-like BadF-type ATPase
VTRVVAGLDIGGTKTAIAVEGLGGERLAEAEVSSADWSAAEPPVAAEWILRCLGAVAPVTEVVALGVGAQGCDSVEHCAHLERELASRGLRARVVNDAALVVPAAGLDAGIGVVAGTGAIAVGRDAAGRQLFAGGWGWVLGDDAGAAGIVREATRAVLEAHDAGAADDGLLGALQAAFAVGTPEGLARAVNDEPTPESWGPRAPVVFAAADAGSGLAAGVVEAAGAHLGVLVGRLLARGALGHDVVAAGSVIVRQPRLATSLRRRLANEHPALTLHLLSHPPVTGALALARSLLTPEDAAEE